MLYNLNARKLADNSIFVQYNEEGKAKDASFRTWTEFTEWLHKQVTAILPQE